MPKARALLYGLLLVAYGTLFSSLVVGPPAVAFSLGLAVAILVVVHLGVGLLNLQVFTDSTRRAVRAGNKLSLTFDDGPHPLHTREVLAKLRSHGQRATFFVVGDKVAQHPDVAREIVADGHELGLHSDAHAYSLTLWAEDRIVRDLQRNAERIEQATGQQTRLFRPPVGLTSPRLHTAIAQLGLSVIGWSVRAYDGLWQPPPDEIVRRLRAGLAAGAIVLLHDCRERSDARPASLDALDALLAELAAKNLSSVPVSELLGPAFASTGSRCTSSS